MKKKTNLFGRWEPELNDLHRQNLIDWPILKNNAKYQVLYVKKLQKSVIVESFWVPLAVLFLKIRDTWRCKTVYSRSFCVWRQLWYLLSILAIINETRCGFVFFLDIPPKKTWAKFQFLVTLSIIQMWLW